MALGKVVDAETLGRLDALVSSIGMSLSEGIHLYNTEYLKEELTARGFDSVDDIVEFYLGVAIACYYGRLSLDRSEGDFEFGFAELGLMLESLGSVNSKVVLEDNIKSQFIVDHLRDVSLGSSDESDLIGYLTDDIIVVRLALGLSVERSVASEGLRVSIDEVEGELEDSDKVKLLKGQSQLVSLVNTVISDILLVYDKVLSGGYELESYDSIPSRLVLDDTGERSSLNTQLVTVSSGYLVPRKETAYFQMATTLLSSFRNVEVMSRTADKGASSIELLDRVVDVRDIYALEEGRSLYYPFKMLEFILGRRVTYRAKSQSYSKDESCRVWSHKDKQDGTQRYAVECYLRRLVWDYLSHVSDSLGLWSNPVFSSDGSFGSGIFSMELAECYKVQLVKFKNVFCTFSFLKQRSGSEELWAEAEWVVVAPESNYVGSDFGKNSRTYSMVFGSYGEVQPPRVDIERGIVVAYYRHIADQSIADSKVLFAYKALEALQEKGEQLSFRNMLVGRSLEGSIITSSELGKFNLLKTMFLAISAGSRSGKGVLTNNIIASATQDNIPIPLLDRKPDTSVAYYELTGGSDERGTPYAFLVQGGAIATGEMSCDESTKAELMWDSNPKIMGRRDRLVPSYMRSYAEKYTGFWGDFAYYRAFILWLGIITLRSKLLGSEVPSEKAMYETLGGTDGILCVVDEVSNWGENFARYFSRDGLFNESNMLLKSDVEKISKRSRDLVLAKESGKEERIRTVEYDLESYRSDSTKRKAYFADMLNSFKETQLALRSANDAGFKNKEARYSTILMIGQNLNTGDITMPLSVTANGVPSKTSGITPHLLPATLYELDTAYLLGFNMGERSNQGWRDVDGSDANKYLTDTARQFGYYSSRFKRSDIVSGDESLARTTYKTDDSSRGGVVYFKPFLILNDSDESSSPVTQLRTTLGDKYEKIKELNSDGNGHWNPKIGIRDYLSATGNSDTARSFIRAREIADYVIGLMGYQGDYLDYCMDMRPEWNYSVQDIVDACLLGKSNEDIRSRYVYFEVERLLGEDSSVDSSSSSVGSVGGGGIQNMSVFDRADASGDSSDGLGSVDVSSSGVSSEGVSSPSEGASSPSEGVSSPSDGIADIDIDGIDTTRVKTPIEHAGDENISGSFDVNSRGQRNPFKGREIDPVLVGSLADSLGVSSDALTELLMLLKGNSGDSNRIKVNRSASNLGNSDIVSESSRTYSRVERLNKSKGFGSGSDSMFDEGVRVDGYVDACKFITGYLETSLLGDYNSKDYYKRLSKLHTIRVLGDSIYMNNKVFAPDSFGSVTFVNLTNEEKLALSSKSYAYFFDWTSLFIQEASVTTLEFDSIDYVSSILLPALRSVEGSSKGSDVVSVIFGSIVFSKLERLVIDGVSFTRSDYEEDVISHESIFRSSRRREQVLRNSDDVARSYRRSAWSNAKRHYEEGHGFRAVGSTIGAGIGAMAQGMSKTARVSNRLFDGARRIGSAVMKDFKREFTRRD